MELDQDIDRFTNEGGDQPQHRPPAKRALSPEAVERPVDSISDPGTPDSMGSDGAPLIGRDDDQEAA